MPERIAPHPVVTPNRAIAPLDGDGRPAGHHRLLSARAHLLERSGELTPAYEHCRRAARATASPAEQRRLEGRAARLRPA
ncbi:hypothetical protein [Kitasatospora sp. NPDC004531]